MSELHWILYSGAVGLIVIGLIGITTLKDVFRIILSLVIAEAGANLLLVIAGFRFDAVAPILTSINDFDPNISMVDPVPQAMVLHYRTLDMREIHSRLVSDINLQGEVHDLASDDAPAHHKQSRVTRMEQAER
jgi:multisubunit Na+/H+ antiporter MnhC subunit